MLNVTFGAAAPRMPTQPVRSTLCARGYTIHNGRCVKAPWWNMRRARPMFAGPAPQITMLRDASVDLSPLRHLPPHEVGMPTQAQLLEAATMWASLPPYRRHALVAYIAKNFPALFDEGIQGLATAGSRVSNGLVPNPM